MTEDELKKFIVDKLLLEERIVQIGVIPVEKAVLPAHLKEKDPEGYLHLQTLEIGLDMVVPIPNLDVGDAGIRATLSFARTPFECWIPWSTIVSVGPPYTYWAPSAEALRASEPPGGEQPAPGGGGLRLVR